MFCFLKALVIKLQIHYLYYALKIIEIYVKSNTSKYTTSNETKDIRTHYERLFIKMFSYFRLNLFSNNLTWCLHSLMNSFLLFNNWLPLTCSIRYGFSAKHSRQKLTFALPYTFSTIEYLILDIIWFSFNNHIYFDHSVLYLYCSWLKYLLWFPNCALKDVSARSKYILVPLFALFSTSARDIRFGVRHWFCNRKFSLVRRLQPHSVVLGLNSLLLSDEVIDDMLLVQL